MSLLSVEKVGISFGGVRALSDVSLELNRGEILGLIGPNGAGKTTLFNCISGVLAPDKGRIRFEDQSIVRLKPHERARKGIARTFQNLQLWGTMTVLENCMTPIDALSNRNIISDAFRLPWSQMAEKGAEERGRGVLHALGLTSYEEELAADLPVGIQRRVELARALCMRPKLLLLDEPASGLDAGETAELASTLTRIRERFRTSILLVDHDMSLVMRACHHIYVLDFGELIASGKPEKIRDDPNVIAAYLGESTKEPARPEGDGKIELREVGEKKPGTPLLKVEGLAAGYGHIEVIRNVNFEVGAGEVVACIGANGAGKTTTLRAISGLIKPTKGTVEFDGASIGGDSPESIVRRGMVHIPQGRGLFPKLTVEETLKLAHYSGLTSDDFDAAFQVFPVLKDRRGQLVGTLSGGQQQMLAMARAILVKPKLLLLDEMSQGLAPLVVAQLFDRIDLIRQQGVAVFLVEQFVGSALAVADRAYIFEQGTIGHAASAAQLRSDQSVIASAYLGSAKEGELKPTAVAANGSGEMLEEMELHLPAELKRGLQERAQREGKKPEELVLEALSSREKSKK